MSFPTWLRPSFWERDAAGSTFKSLFDYRRLWRLAVALSLGVSLVPLLTMAVIDYNLSRDAAEQESVLRSARLVSNARRSIAGFLEERIAALSFLIVDNEPGELIRKERLEQLLTHLKQSFGGFTDLGVIDATGLQLAYAGPYDLVGRNYAGQPWFQEIVDHGAHVSEVYRGFRDVPHLVLSVRRDLPDGGFLILRAAIDTERFTALVTDLDLVSRGDAFLLDREGVLQTPSRLRGGVLEHAGLPVPPWSETSESVEVAGDDGHPSILSYAYIPDSPFILVITMDRDELLRSWYSTRLQMAWFLGVSIGVMVLVLVGVATYLVGKIHLADLRRVQALRQAEHASKMASIGRLAAGVAHEINNPLAIIGEKAGLMKDILAFGKEYAGDSRLMGVVDSILAAVERGGAITKRLLGFARHIDVSMEPVNLPGIVEECLGFLRKEAEYRSIAIEVAQADEVPVFVSDRGKLQQIFLNLFNNAFAAMSDGGHLRVGVSAGNGEAVVTVADDGCGIPRQDLERIFEPFFSTKKKQGGTGLGLSITYGLVQELGGRIEVESAVGAGTTFTVRLPLGSGGAGKESHDARSAG